MGEEILQVVSIACGQGNLEVEPARGFEPLTFRLQGGCSTAELRRSIFVGHKCEKHLHLPNML